MTTFADTNAEIMNKIPCVPAMQHLCKVNWQEARNKEHANFIVTNYRFVTTKNSHNLCYWNAKQDRWPCKNWLHSAGISTRISLTIPNWQKRTSRVDIHVFSAMDSHHATMTITNTSRMQEASSDSQTVNSTCQNFYYCARSITSANKFIHLTGK